jgi:hypothetical protein
MPSRSFQPGLRDCQVAFVSVPGSFPPGGMADAQGKPPAEERRPRR